MQKVRVRKIYCLSPTGDLCVKDKVAPFEAEVSGETVEEALEQALKNLKFAMQNADNLHKDVERSWVTRDELHAKCVALEAQIEGLRVRAEIGASFKQGLLDAETLIKAKDELIKQLQSSPCVPGWIISVKHDYYLSHTSSTNAGQEKHTDVPVTHKYSGFSSVRVFSFYADASSLLNEIHRLGFKEAKIEEVMLPF